MPLRPLLVLLVALVLAASTGCEAPLKPASKQAEEQSASAPSPTASASSAAPTPTRTLAPTARQAPKPRATRSITVPKLPRTPQYSGAVLGADISWPQCPKGMGIPQKQGQGSPGPVAAARYVILGLTNGPGFYPNPCLGSQVAFVKSRNLLAAAYSVISTPQPGDVEKHGRTGPFDGGTRLGALSNVGYQQARFNLQTMRGAGLQSPIIWLDVEPVPEFDWPADPTANAAVVRGAARGYTDAGFRIGAYSTQALWQGVVGDLRLNVPEWRAAGQTSREEALRRCGPERMFQGGPGILGQWVQDGRDQNVTCPGTSAQMTRWFHQY